MVKKTTIYIMLYYVLIHYFFRREQERQMYDKMREESETSLSEMQGLPRQKDLHWKVPKPFDWVENFITALNVVTPYRLVHITFNHRSLVFGNCIFIVAYISCWLDYLCVQHVQSLWAPARPDGSLSQVSASSSEPHHPQEASGPGKKSHH